VLSAKLDDGDLPCGSAFPVDDGPTRGKLGFCRFGDEIEPGVATGTGQGSLSVVGEAGSGRGRARTGKVHLATTEENTILVGPVDRVGFGFRSEHRNAGLLACQSGAAPVKRLAV